VTAEVPKSKKNSSWEALLKPQRPFTPITRSPIIMRLVGPTGIWNPFVTSQIMPTGSAEYSVPDADRARLSDWNGLLVSENSVFVATGTLKRVMLASSVHAMGAACTHPVHRPRPTLTIARVMMSAPRPRNGTT